MAAIIAFIAFAETRRGDGPGVDTTSASYHAGLSTGRRWAQVYRAAGNDPASREFRWVDCANIATAAVAHGINWKNGASAVKDVNSNDFVAGCMAGIRAVMGPPS